MTRQEHLDIIAFIERTVGGAQPPMDVEADAIIRALFKRNQDAAYRMTMLAMSLSPPPSKERPPGPQRRSWLTGFFDRRGSMAARREPVML